MSNSYRYEARDEQVWYVAPTRAASTIETQFATATSWAWASTIADALNAWEDRPRWVAVYQVDRQYGGPEEGGWYYDAGTLVARYHCADAATVDAVLDFAREKYPRTDARLSVLGGDDYSVMVTDTEPPAFYPEDRPHYE